MSRRDKKGKPLFRNVPHLKRFDIWGIILTGVFLIILWIECISLITSGHYEGHYNYFGQPVGAFILLCALIVVTPVYIVLTIKSIRTGKTDWDSPRESRKEREFWAQKWPWKWPWN
jgi:hypothetical protein